MIVVEVKGTTAEAFTSVELTSGEWRAAHLFRTALDEESWQSFSRGSAIRRAGREGFARNVAVALGNWGDPSAAAPLS